MIYGLAGSGIIANSEGKKEVTRPNFIAHKGSIWI